MPRGARGRRRAAAPSGWDLALTGGFVATGLVDPDLCARQRHRVSRRASWCARPIRRARSTSASRCSRRSTTTGCRGSRRCRSASACAATRARRSISGRRCASDRTPRSRRRGDRSGRGAAGRRRRRDVPVTDTNFLTDLGTRTTSVVVRRRDVYLRQPAIRKNRRDRERRTTFLSDLASSAVSSFLPRSGRGARSPRPPSPCPAPTPTPGASGSCARRRRGSASAAP